MEAALSGELDHTDALQHGNVHNRFFAFDTIKQVWQRLPDGPLSTMLYDFVFISVGHNIYLHGGETRDGATKATLWKVHLYTDPGLSLSPLWSVLGVQGIGARKQHCAAELNGTIFFWGGKSGIICVRM
jgi:hypothetical protein